ncbi:unnamed protein product [Pylaiella littoralis]
MHLVEAVQQHQHQQQQQQAIPKEGKQTFRGQTATAVEVRMTTALLLRLRLQLRLLMLEMEEALEGSLRWQIVPQGSPQPITSTFWTTTRRRKTTVTALDITTTNSSSRGKQGGCNSSNPWNNDDDDGHDASAQWSRPGKGEERGFEVNWEGDGGGEGRAWKHEDLKQLLQDLEDTEYGGGGGGGSKRRRGRERYRSRPSRPLGGSGGAEGVVPGFITDKAATDDGAPTRQPGAGWRSPPDEGGQGNGAGAEHHAQVGQQQQHQHHTNRPLSAREAGDTGGGRDARGRSQGLTLGPPPPLPTTGAGAGAAGKVPSDQGGTSSFSSPGVSSTPSQTGQKVAPNQFSKRRVRVTWEAEGWEEGEENAAEVESAGTDAAESTSIGNMDEYDDGGYYFVADTRSAESQQHYHEGLVGTLLQSGDFSDTGSAGTWTDAETEEFVVGHNHGRLEHLTTYGYHQRYPTALMGSRVGGRGSGRRLVMPPGASIWSIGPSAQHGARTSILDLDYSAKVLDYGRKDVTGPPKILTLRSWSRLLGSASIATAGAFLAVSPNNAPRDQYLALFRRNLGLIAASLVGPAVYSFLLYDGSKANINTYVRVVTFAFTWGYLITFALEIVAATFFQLCMLAVVEPAAFKLTPHVPAIFLPWVLREHGYVPSSLFSCAADLLSFCVGAPIVECAMMVWIVRRLGALPERKASPLPTAPTAEGASGAGAASGTSGNARKGMKNNIGPDRAGQFGQTTEGTASSGAVVASSSPEGAASSAGGVPARKLGLFSRRGTTSTTAVSDATKAARTAAEAAEAAQEPTHVHTYLLYVLGSAIGLKAACTVQRVLVYTREHHEHKAFFALARGFFPLFELCGSIMAMNLARRDILGDTMNKLQLFFVAVSLNAYAVFRGTKPLFKWASSKPWDELQVKAWVFPTGMTPFQRARKGFASVAWSIVILRVTAHVIKTYWRLNRLHSSRLRQQHEMAAAAAAAAEQRAAFAMKEAMAGAGRSSS